MERFICSHIRSPWFRKRSRMPTAPAGEEREGPTERMPSRCWTAEEHRAAGTLQRILFLERDPISLQPIRRRFLLLRGEHLLAFDAFEFAAYVIATGDIRDPITRQPLATHEHLRLARLSEKKISSMQGLQKQYEQRVERSNLTSLLLDDILLHTRRHQEYATDLVDILRQMLSNHPADLVAAMRFLESKGYPLSSD